eukprot:Rmarinus@m.19487
MKIHPAVLSAVAVVAIGLGFAAIKFLKSHQEKTDQSSEKTDKEAGDPAVSEHDPPEVPLSRARKPAESSAIPLKPDSRILEAAPGDFISRNTDSEPSGPHYDRHSGPHVKAAVDLISERVEGRSLDDLVAMYERHMEFISESADSPKLDINYFAGLDEHVTKIVTEVQDVYGEEGLKRLRIPTASQRDDIQRELIAHELILRSYQHNIDDIVAAAVPVHHSGADRSHAASSSDSPEKRSHVPIVMQTGVRTTRSPAEKCFRQRAQTLFGDHDDPSRTRLDDSYWTWFREKLEEDPPSYKLALANILEVKERMAALTPNRPEMLETLDEYVDSDLLRQMLDKNALDYSTVGKILLFLCRRLRDLEAPVHNKDTDAFIKTLEGRMQSSDPMNAVLSDALRFMNECLRKISEDTAHLAADFASNILQGDFATHFERSKFEQRLEEGLVTLQHTEEWIASALADIAAEEKEQAVVTPRPRDPDVLAVFACGFGMLLQAKHPINPVTGKPKLPETFRFDNERIVRHQNDFQLVTLVASCVQSVKNVFKAHNLGLAFSPQETLSLKGAIMGAVLHPQASTDMIGKRVVEEVQTLLAGKPGSPSLSEKDTRVLAHLIEKASLNPETPMYRVPADRIATSISRAIYRVLFNRFAAGHGAEYGIPSSAEAPSEEWVGAPLTGAGMSFIREDVTRVVKATLPLVLANFSVYQGYYCGIRQALRRQRNEEDMAARSNGTIAATAVPSVKSVKH